MNLPLFSSPQMQTFEQYACDAFGITVEYMMQRAGHAIADMVSEELMKEMPEKKPILVVAGKGNNGGDALVAARMLHEKGQEVEVLSPYPDEEFTIASRQEISELRSSGLRVFSAINEVDPEAAQKYGLIIDGLFGFSLEGNPLSPAKEIIEWMNASGVPILSVDVPSGLDVSTGRLMSPAVKATYTLALGMPKAGMDVYRDHTGKLFLGSLDIPQRAYEKVGVKEAIFQGKNYIPLH